MEDMRSYEALIRPTVSTYYHGRKVTTCSAPTSGPMLISVLNILEQFNLRVKGLTGLNLHRLIESLKYGFAFRTEMGDPEFTKNQERLDQLVTKTWADQVRRNISDVRKTRSL
jgi:gamma-glutamyltranspeptidase/glutathione hydrolase/leukotriene-C4 hydrolase